MQRRDFLILFTAMMGLGSVLEIGVLSTATFAQTFGKRWGWGFGVGTNQLYSDLAKTGFGLSAEAHVTRRLGGRTGLTLGIGYGELPFQNPRIIFDSDPTSAVDQDTITAKGAFKTNFIRGDLRFDYELTNGNFRPYLALGLSGINFKLRGGNKRFNDAAVLAGGGVRYMLGQRLAFDLGGNFRYTTGDDFDLTRTNKAKDGFFTVLAGLTFFGGGGTDIYAQQAPEEETESQDLSAFQERINQLESTPPEQPQDMQEYMRLKSRMDELNQQIEQKENEVNTLRTAVVDKKSDVESLESRLASTSANVSSAGFSRSYEEALNKFYSKRYREAVEMFSALLAQFPNHSLASNCEYWIGESQFGTGNYQEAITAFNRVLSYPKSLKKDDALLMLGRSYLQLNQREDARQAFNRLLQEYPNSEFVVKAEEWLNRM